MSEEIILIGGGGHSYSCIDVIESSGKYVITGILDKNKKIGSSILGYPVIGSDSDISRIINKNINFLITVGQLDSPETRIRIYNSLKRLNARLPVIVSPDAYVSKYSEIGEGTVIMHKAVINSGVKIGVNCIINSFALAEHESIIGDHCHISTGSLINGQCKIGDRVFAGSGSVVRNNITIASDSVIGAGTVVIENIAIKGTYAGNPARKIK